MAFQLDVHDAGIAEITRPHRHDRTSVPARAADEELPRLGLGCLRAAAPSHQRASATACSTTSRSTKPLNCDVMLPGRLTTRISGVSTTPSLWRSVVPGRWS